MPWNWDAVTALGSLAGAIGIIATLFYLAGQIRQSALATAGQTAREAVTAMRSFNEALVADPLAEEAFRKGTEGLSGLTEDERARFAHLALNFLKIAEDQRQYWARRREFFTESFQAEYASWKDPGLDRVAHIARGVPRDDGSP